MDDCYLILAMNLLQKTGPPRLLGCCPKKCSTGTSAAVPPPQHRHQDRNTEEHRTSVKGSFGENFTQTLVLEMLWGLWLPRPVSFAGMPLASLRQGRAKYGGKKWSSFEAAEQRFWLVFPTQEMPALLGQLISNGKERTKLP